MVRVKHGPADPRTDPAPSIGSSRIVIMRSSIVSLIGTAELHEPAATVSGMAVRSDVMIVSHRAAASLNVVN